MSQVILIENDDAFREILKLNIMKNIGCNVIEKKSAEEVVSLLEIVPNIDMVICREKMALEKTGSKLASFFEKENSNIPLLVLGSSVSDYKNLTAINENQNWKEIVKTIGSILGVKVSLDENRLSVDYVPIAIHFLMNITSTSMGCDVFIRVKKGEEFQYIKRFHAEDNFTRIEIEKYKDAGLKEFYISKEHFSSFVNFVTSQLTLKLESSKLTGSDRLQVAAEAYELTLERIEALGIDEHTIGIVDESLKSMQASLSEENALAIFLKTLKANKLSYAYSHSYLCSLILHKIVTHFDWQSVQIKEKLTFIAYFHDISLKEKMMGFHSEADLAKSELSSKEKNDVLSHALKSASIVEQFPNIPIGIGSILKEHHGARNGIGFPEDLSIAISPISMMFMVVENFVDEFLKIDGAPSSEDFNGILEKLGLRYNKLTYEQTLVALENMVLHKKKTA